ncbi:hypothetical protein P7C73_g5909, partial [Tremellales sp. Uapishka_1]
MSDSQGLGTGGVSPLYSVGAASASDSCTVRSTDTDFLFYLNETSITASSDSPHISSVYWDKTAVSPVTIIGAIPGGQAFEYAAPAGTDSWDWKANIASGTQFMLAAFDSGSNRQGGSSDLCTVQGATDNSCLDDSSPSSTASATATRTGTQTAPAGAIKTVTAIASASADHHSGIAANSIAGIVVGVVILVLILQAFILWFCCRRQIAALIATRKENKARGGRATQAGAVDLAEHDGVSLAPGWISREGSVRDPQRISFGAESSISPFWDPAPPFSREHSDSSTSSPRISQVGSESRLSLATPLDAFASAPPTPTSSRPLGSMSKSQLVASMSGPGSSASGSEAYHSRLPPMEAPSGGFRRHQDAGPLEARPREGDEREVEVEELPPLYSDDWENSSARER